MADVNMTGNSHVNVAAVSLTVCHMVVGVPGNVVVLYIFMWRFPPSPFNVLVSVLAVSDLLVCATIMPADLVISTCPLPEPAHGALCKALAFFIGLATFTSSIIFVVIAYFRYKSICQPHGRPVRLLDAKIATVVAVLLAGVSNCLTPLTFGSRPAGRGDRTAQHLECGVTKQAERFYAIVFYSVVFVLVSTSTSALAYCYMRVGWALWRRSHVQPSTVESLSGGSAGSVGTTGVTASNSETRPTRSLVPSHSHLLTPALTHTQSTTERESPEQNRASDTNLNVTHNGICSSVTTYIECFPENNEMLDPNNKVKNGGMRSPVCTLAHSPTGRDNPQLTADSRTEVSATVSGTSLLTTTIHPHRTRDAPGRKREGCRAGRVKQTVHAVVLMAVVNAVFLVSYLPHAAMMTVYAVLRLGNYEHALDTDVFSICMRSPYLSNVCNPFIYGLGSGEFRKELKFVLSKVIAIFHLR